VFTNDEIYDELGYSFKSSLQKFDRNSSVRFSTVLEMVKLYGLDNADYWDWRWGTMGSMSGFDPAIGQPAISRRSEASRYISYGILNIMVFLCT
jgi:hypothetical protein